MKQKDAIKAYWSAMKLNRQDTRPRTARRVFSLVTALQPSFEFQQQEEQKIFARHPKFNPQASGIKFKNDEEKKAAYDEVKIIDQELEEIANTDFPIEFEKFDISEEEQEQLQLSGEDYGALQEFINFD